MTERPIFVRSPRIHSAVALLLVLAALLLAAGCESQSPSENAPPYTTATQTLKTISTRHPTPTTYPPVTTSYEPEPVTVTTNAEESESRSPVPAPQPINYRPEYIKMDSTLYSAGDVVQFYLVNKGPEINGCNYPHPPYTVYQLSQDGTRRAVSSGDPNRSYLAVIIADEPGSATGPLSLDTRRLVPGRYLIWFDCGNNVAREFVIQARSPAIIS